MSLKISHFNRFAQLSPVRVVSMSNVAGSYFNGTTNNGVGATLTANSAAALTIDSVAVVTGDRVLLQGQSSSLQNGIYDVIIPGSASVAWVLQRSNDFQNIEQMIPGYYVPVAAGTADAGAIFTLIEPRPAAVGVSAISFVSDSNAGGSAFLTKANNLSDVQSASTSRTNLGLGTMATQAASAVAITGGTIAGAAITTSSFTGGTISGAAMTTGSIATATSIQASGPIQAGLSGTAGALSSFPASGSKGSLVIQGVANTGNTNTTISNAAMGQASVISITDPGAATANLVPVASTVSIPAGFTVGAIQFVDITVGEAALAAGGHVTLKAATGADQYKIRNMWANKGGTNFSGGGGDRLLQVSDGTTVYSVIPATNLQTLVNSGWGITTTLPYPAGAGVSTNTSTVAGATLFAAYSGGTTDYTTGSVVLTLMLEKVA